MPSWNPLSAQERADLVAYVKHFSARFVTEKPGTPIEVPPKPEVTADRIKDRAGRISEGGMLEVSRANRQRQWTVCRHPDRRSEPSDCSLTTFTTERASNAAPAMKTFTGSS